MFLFKRHEVYYIEYFDKKTGTKRRVSTGEKNEAEAVKVMEHLAKKLHIAVEEAVTPKPDVQSCTIAEFQQRYEEYVASVFSKAYLQIVRDVFKMMKREVGVELLSELTAKLAERFIITTFSRAPYAASQYLRTLKAAFTRAEGWGDISQNPFAKVKIPRLPRLLPVFISQAEFQKILDHTETQDFKDIFTTAFHTGMRRGELLNLRWEAIDLNACTLRVESTQSFSTKWKKERLIPLNQTIVDLFKRRMSVCGPEPSGLAFPTDKGLPYNGEFIGKKFKKAVREAGVNPKVHFHTLRHSFASNLVQKDVPILVVMELLGHEKLSTTQIYSHVKHDNLAEAVKKLDANT